jgi:hypothetical protein
MRVLLVGAGAVGSSIVRIAARRKFFELLRDHRCDVLLNGKDGAPREVYLYQVVAARTSSRCSASTPATRHLPWRPGGGAGGPGVGAGSPAQATPPGPDNQATMRDWGAQAVVWQTAVNPVAALELLEDGAWSGAGVLGPEAFDARPFLGLLPDYGAPWGLREQPPAARQGS